jgi:hypothetical protein
MMHDQQATHLSGSLGTSPVFPSLYNPPEMHACTHTGSSQCLHWSASVRVRPGIAISSIRSTRILGPVLSASRTARTSCLDRECSTAQASSQALHATH